MKIAVFYNLNFGGAKRAAYEQVEYLSKFGHQVDVFTTDQASDTFDFNKVANELYVYKFNFFEDKIPFVSRFINDIKNFYYLNKFHKKIALDIDKNNYDLVLVHPDKLTQSPFILRHLKSMSVYYCQEPLRIVYEYNLRADKNMGFLKYSYEQITRSIRKNLDLKNVRSATFTLASCYHVRERMIECYGVYPKVSYLGINEKKFKSNSKKIKNQIFFVGNKDVVNDGYDLAYNSVNLIPNKIRPKLKIVQWTDKKNKRISDKDLAREYRESIAVLSTSRLETFGLVPLETMASGGVVIATNLSGHRETVANEKTGFLVDLDPEQIKDKIIYLIKNRKVSNEIRKSARKYIESEWNIEKRNRELEKLLFSLIKENQQTN